MAQRRRSGLGDRYYPAAPWQDGPAHFRTITRPASRPPARPCGFGVLTHHRVFHEDLVPGELEPEPTVVVRVP